MAAGLSAPAHIRVAIVDGWAKALFDGARADPTFEVQGAAGLVVGARGPAAYGTGTRKMALDIITPPGVDGDGPVDPAG